MEVKSLATPERGLTVASAETTMVGAIAVTSVPKGTVSKTVFAPSSTAPVVAGDVKSNEIIAFSGVAA